MGTITPGRYRQDLREWRRTYLTFALLAHNGNRTNTARDLGVQRTYLHRLIRDLHITIPHIKRETK